MYYKDMSTTPLEEDFDVEHFDSNEKAKIIPEDQMSQRYKKCLIKENIDNIFILYTNHLIQINAGRFLFTGFDTTI